MTAYIIKVILCSGFFLLGYKLLLEKEKMHRFNRFYLLFSLVFSFVVPLLHLPVYSSAVPTIETVIGTPQINPGTAAAVPAYTPAKEINYLAILLWTIYVVISGLLLFRFVYNLISLFSKVSQYPNIAYVHSKIVLLPENRAPHSFLNYIFLSAGDYKNGDIEKEILVHELTHVREKHSYDMLFIELLRVVFWINPLLLLYRKAIQLNHEFLADDTVINTCHNTAGYQYLLIASSGRQSATSLASRFNYLITKKRLIMMTKTKSFRNVLCRQIALLPVLAIGIFLFSTRIYAQNAPEIVAQVKKEVPSTKEGVSKELLDEYDQILNKSKDLKLHIAYSKLTEKDKARLEEIFLAMSKEQQAKQTVIFMPPLPPLPRVVPSKGQIEMWKDSKKYGLWINEKRVSNAVLDNYENTDFAQVFVSKLTKSAINYGKHYYQVDLMTTKYYDNYYKETIAEKRYHMAIRWGKTKAKSN